MTLIVNMVGGPGAGKSTTAAGVFFELKNAGVNCELVTEYAKDQVWGRTTTTLGNQVYIFAKQYHRLWRLLDQVDVVVTDAPIILSTYYGGQISDTFTRLVVETFNTMDNLTFFLERKKAYNPSGRNQTEDEAKQIDEELYQLLRKHHVEHFIVSADPASVLTIVDRVLDELESTSGSVD